MDRKCRINRKKNLCKIIIKHGTPNEPFTVWDVQAWYIRENKAKVPSVKELSKIMPTLADGRGVIIKGAHAEKGGPILYTWSGDENIYEEPEMKFIVED